MLRREFIKYLTAGAAGEFILPITGATAGAGINVVIIGGGMAGATAAKYLRVWAKKLALDSLVSVTIIDKSDKYVSNIMSNMVLTGEKTLTGLTYSYANLKTKYGVNFIKATVASVDVANGWVYGQLNNTGPVSILLNATPFNRLILATGISFDYSTFGLNVPGSVYANPYDAIPHAWQAGTQTTLLRNQLVNMKAGNHVAIAIPPGPYRCPPGPYERACVLADWLRVKKPGSKLYLLDSGQTADGRPSVEPNNFGYAFANIHKNLVYVQNAKLTNVTAALSGTAKLKTLSLEPAAGASNAVNALTSPTTVTVEVANIIPKMRAGDLTRSILDAGGLDSDKRWALVDEKSYKSAIPNVYVIGDGIKSAYQPKAGHIGNQQAKVCADAILREFSNVALYDAPITNSACFTPVTTSLNSQYGARASWLTANFRYGPDATDNNVYRMLKVSTNIESPGAPSKDNFESMGKWFTSLMQDVYS